MPSIFRRVSVVCILGKGGVPSTHRNGHVHWICRKWLWCTIRFMIIGSSTGQSTDLVEFVMGVERGSHERLPLVPPSTYILKCRCFYSFARSLRLPFIDKEPLPTKLIFDPCQDTENPETPVR